MTSPTDSLLWSALLGGWTFMWLVWSFDGDVRAWLAALFPDIWRDGTSRSAVAAMSPTALDKWFVVSSVPLAVCQLMSCRKCYSAHVSSAGTLILLLFGALHPVAAPLVWACGAAIGNLLYDYSHRPPKN